MPYKVVVVDDHILIAKAIAGIINNFDNYKVLYEAENGKAMIDKFSLPGNIPDIVLLDISMPVMDGFATAKWIRTHHPDILILSLSMQDDDMSLLRMIKAGANGYLLKNIHPKELESALDVIVSGNFYFPEWASSKIFNNISDERQKKEGESSISEKEDIFLKYCCTEMTYKEVADKMNVSSRTVEGYRDSLFDKLGLKTRVGLAVYAIKSGRYNVK
jgi:DNA-binding NarL/FixJ family response regulator